MASRVFSLLVLAVFSFARILCIFRKILFFLIHYNDWTHQKKKKKRNFRVHVFIYTFVGARVIPIGECARVVYRIPGTWPPVGRTLTRRVVFPNDNNDVNASGLVYNIPGPCSGQGLTNRDGKSYKWFVSRPLSFRFFLRPPTRTVRHVSVFKPHIPPGGFRAEIYKTRPF